MKKKIYIWLLIVLFTNCDRDNTETITPEYKDWYALRAPKSEPIQAVYGDIDTTVIIATTFNIYYTKDRGKTWLKAKYDLDRGLFGLTSVNDTLMVLDGRRTISTDSVAYATDPYYFSTDRGINWQYYRGYKRLNVPLNVLKTASGTVYSINEVFTPLLSGSSTASYVETVGIKVSDGRQIGLPQRHQIKSIYFDKKQRLYVAASAPVCGRLKDFSFCGDENGTLYVSKEPQP